MALNVCSICVEGPPTDKHSYDRTLTPATSPLGLNIDHGARVLMDTRDREQIK